jgi:HEAT repeat protein
MCTRRRIASTTAVLVALAFLAWLAFHSSEPSYRGKSLSAWLDQARDNNEGANEYLSDIYLDTPSARAIRAMGKDALPTLLRMAYTRDTFLRFALGDLSQHHPWLGLHTQSLKEIHDKTAYGFLVLGPEAKSALPELISMLDGPAPEVRAMASFAIAKLGPDGAPAIPALQRVTTNSPAAYQSRWISRDVELALAAFALGAMGPVARSALPQIELLRKDSDPFVRGAAEVAFIKISGTNLDAIFEALKDPSNSTNWLFGAQAVLFLGTNGAPAIPFLLSALQNTNASVKEKALGALSAIHMSPETTIPAVLPLVSATNTNNRLRDRALSVLHNLAPSARGMVPTSTLLNILQDPDEDIRRRATNALRQIDPEAARKAGIDSGDDRN